MSFSKSSASPLRTAQQDVWGILLCQDPSLKGVRTHYSLLNVTFFFVCFKTHSWSAGSLFFSFLNAFRDMGLSFHFGMHSLIDSFMDPDRGSNL